jgi:hypothetical protein
MGGHIPPLSEPSVRRVMVGEGEKVPAKADRNEDKRDSGDGEVRSISEHRLAEFLKKVVIPNCDEARHDPRAR